MADSADMTRRSAEEMLGLIMGYAEQDERVRVVVMEGSRLNELAPRDAWQDFDITYLVTDVESFTADDGWLDVFGARVMMQKPEAMALFAPDWSGNVHFYGYLMQFVDGNRIDLKLAPVEGLEDYFAQADSLTRVLRDKDGRCPLLEAPSDRDYWVAKPSAALVDDCANEFWHLSIYVTKGLYRGEMLYAAHHLGLMREQLLQMISWQVGVETEWSRSVGKSYKYLDRFVSAALWADIMKTYAAGSEDAIWQALFLCCDLFREATEHVTRALGYPYPEYDEHVSAFLARY
jgi:aminoglycoside 6-adenylyltransferase